MNSKQVILWALLATALRVAPVSEPARADSLREQNERLFDELQTVHRLSDAQMTEIRAIFERSSVLGQGNPAISRHPMTPEQCRSRLETIEASYADPKYRNVCQAPYMAPLFDPATQSVDDARSCIDQFEFPDIPCAYPVVWVRAREAAEICHVMGKRLCDAHEWEGACAGALLPPDYRFELAAHQSPGTAVKLMRDAHNRAHEGSKSWSYGSEYQRGICAAASAKSNGCEGGGWRSCGSNTYPAGSFPECRSRLGVYDLHGNAAEHMSLPLSSAQMASAGSRDYGVTEMKGSWFIFDSYRAHEDWCRWRAPFWHGSRVMDPQSHHNYHLGFRCCKTLGTAGAERPQG